VANTDDDNLAELTDDDKLDGLEYPPERPLGVLDRTIDDGQDSVVERMDREVPDDLASALEEDQHLGTLVAPGGDGGLDLEADAVASEMRSHDPLGLDISTQDLEEVRPAEEEAMHLTEAPPMGDGDGYLEEG
jgi:hypothetical protein